MITQEVRTKREKMMPVFPANNSFTFKGLQELNPNISSQTLRLRLMQAIKEGKVTKGEETLETGRVGRREYLYSAV